MLTDTDPMPFGKYKGTPMQDVPVEYLHWCYHNIAFHKDLNDYIRRSIDALKMEKPDLIWNIKK